MLSATSYDISGDETRVLYRNDLRRSFFVIKPHNRDNYYRCPGVAPGFAGLDQYSDLIHDLRALARCPGAKPAGTEGSSTGDTLQLYEIPPCDDAGQLSRYPVTVAVGPTKYLRAAHVKSGVGLFLLNRTVFTDLVFTPKHLPRTEFVVPPRVCGGDPRYTPAREKPGWGAFDSNCKVRTFSPLIKYGILLGAVGAGALVGVLIYSMNERKKEADQKKVA